MKPTKTPTIYDVAKLAEVSEATVSYVLGGRRGGKSRISEETRQRVLESAQQLGYVPNQSARSLRRQRTERVCLVLPGLGIPYYDTIGQDLQRVADQYSYSVIVIVGGSAERELHVLEQLRRRLADGALIINPRSMDKEELRLLAKAGLSLVVWSNRVEPAGFDVWRTSEAEACREAMKYLVKSGHRRIAFIGQPSERPAHYDRYQCWAAVLKDSGIPPDPSLTCEDDGSREGAYRIVRALLQRNDPPSAIIAASDIAAISAVWAIRDAQLRIPQDVAVIGTGNIPEGEITTPPLTTIGPHTQDFRDVAAVLFDRLTRRVPSEGQVHMLPWHFIKRGSA